MTSEENQERDSKRRKIDVGQLWILDCEQTLRQNYYFSSEANAKEFLAHLVFEWLEEMYQAELKLFKEPIDDESKGDLVFAQNLIEKIGLQKNEQLVSLMDSRIFPKLIDQPLLQYHLPKPEQTFSFDDICKCLQEFGNAIEWYETEEEAGDSTTASKATAKKDIEGYVKTFKQMILYQKWVSKTQLEDEISHLGVQQALDRARTFLKYLTI